MLAKLIIYFSKLKKRTKLIVLCTATAFCLIILISLIRFIYVITDNSAELCKSFHDEEKYSESLPFCEKSCNRDNGESCSYLADFYALDDKTQDLHKLIIYAEKGCKLDNSRACLVLARIYQYGLGGSADYDQAVIYSDKACDLDTTGRFCNQLGDLYRDARTKRTNYQKAIEYYKKSCELGYGEGCNNHGDLYVIGRGGIKPDHQLAIKYYDQACNLGHSISCNLLAEDEKIQRQKRRAYAEKSCNGDDGVGCVLLGNMYNTEQNYQQAMKSYDKACSMYYAEGCSALISLYRLDRNDWKHDYIKAMEYGRKECEAHASCERFRIRDKKIFEICERSKKQIEEDRIKLAKNAGKPYKPSCQGVDSGILYSAERECEKRLNSGDSSAVSYCNDLCNHYYGMNSCINLGIIYQNGKVVEQDSKKAQEYFNMVCDKNIWDIKSFCEIIGKMYDTGENVPQDKNIAKKYLKELCDLGYGPGCSKYEGLD